MKKISVLFAFIIFAHSLQAQFSSATLQASGLTCAMCTKAINNALQELTFVGSVTPDIKNSAFNIVFKPGKRVDIDELKKAVEDAGFSVARLSLTGNFNQVSIKNDGHSVIDGNTFHFLKVNNQVLNGQKRITIVDKNFVTAKEFKKFAAATAMSCIQSGKAEGCCRKEGIEAHARIYHATI